MTCTETATTVINVLGGLLDASGFNVLPDRDAPVQIDCCADHLDQARTEMLDKLAAVGIDGIAADAAVLVEDLWDADFYPCRYEPAPAVATS